MLNTRALCRRLAETWNSVCQSQCHVHFAHSFPSQTAETQNIKGNKKIITKMILDFHGLFSNQKQWTSAQVTATTVSSLAYNTNEFDLQFEICLIWIIFMLFHTFYEGDGTKGPDLKHNFCHFDTLAKKLVLC